MAELCPGLLYAFVWILLLWFIMWPVAGLLAGIYVLALPFTPCFPCLKEICTTLLKWIQWCEVIGQNIKEMKPLTCSN